MFNTAVTAMVLVTLVLEELVLVALMLVAPVVLLQVQVQVTRIEMTHEIDEEAEKCFISVSVGGREVMKQEVVREEGDYPLGRQMALAIRITRLPDP